MLSFAIVAVQVALLAQAGPAQEPASSRGPCAAFSGPEPRADVGELPRKPLEGPLVVHLDLSARDIASVIWHPDGATVRLNDRAAEALQVFTHANPGRAAVVTIDGMKVTGAVVQGTLPSGTVAVSEDALRGPLCKVLEAAGSR